MMNVRCTKLQWTGLVLILLVPMLARAQSPEERIDAAMARARGAGIPVSLLESKRDEGQAKGISMDRIAEAIQTRLQHLERAQQAMNRGAKDIDAAQLSVGADAIGAGVSEAVLSDITASTGRERRSVAVAAVTHLITKERVASNVALARVREALAKGPEALANIHQKPAPRGNAPDSVPATGNRGNSGQSGTNGSPSSIPPPGQANRPDPPTRGRGPQGRGNQGK